MSCEHNENHDEDKIINYLEVGEVLNKIMETFHKNQFVRNFENQKYLNNCIRTAIHKHFDANNDYLTR